MPPRFAPADFVPLAAFPLGWRWTDGARRTLPADSLGAIRPLRADVAAGLPAPPPPAPGAAATFRADDPAGDVRRRLGALPPDGGTAVVVQWDARTAVLTEWRVFVRHWDDFCYPARDDVVVRPLDDAWALEYFRYDVFRFALRAASP